MKVKQRILCVATILTALHRVYTLSSSNSTHAPQCNDTDVRLVGGSSTTEGRVEVCDSGIWGTVCGWWYAWNEETWHQYITNTEASVICRQLGLPHEGAEITYFEAGEDPISLYYVVCSGDEERLSDCSYSEYNMDYCLHAADIGVVCQASEEVCNDDAIRLADGTSEFNGRVEVCIEEEWGTVCDDFWEDEDAAVVCRNLGFPTRFATAVPRFGGGEGPIHMDDVQCNGTESKLTDCLARRISNCIHREDAGVICYANECNNTDIRLVDGASEFEGRVEVCISGVWGTVCDDFWDANDAAAACRQLGYSTEVAYAVTYGGGEGPIVLDDVSCNGTESTLTGCQASQTSDCQHDEDAGVVCHAGQMCNDTDIRLISSLNNEHEGLVEICYGGIWGTVCGRWANVLTLGWNTHITEREASVICRQLGFPPWGATITFYVLGAANVYGPIFLDYVQCNGTEDRLADCSHNGINIHQCSHYGDVSVSCRSRECNGTDIRLVGGSTVWRGRVDICLDGVWGAVCAGGLNNPTASVICRWLGFPDSGEAVAVPYRHGASPTILSNIECTGMEDHPLNCSHSEVNVQDCPSLRDAGVVCGGIAVGSIVSSPVATSGTNGITTMISSMLPTDSTSAVPIPSTIDSTPTIPISRASTLLPSVFQTQVPTATNPNEDVLNSTATPTVTVTNPDPAGDILGDSSIAVPIFSCILGIIVLVATGGFIAVLSRMHMYRRRKKKFSGKLMQASNSRTYMRHHTYIEGMHAESSFMPQSAVEELSKTTASYAQQLPEDLLIPSYNLRLLDSIGQGEFGVVYKAHMVSAKPVLSRKISVRSFTTDPTMPEIVAVKTLKGYFDTKEIMDIMTESMKMREFNHPNVLGLLGVCTDAGPAPYIIMPFMANGSLLSYLRKERPNLILDETVDEDVICETQKRMMDMCLQIAKGMEYLAANKLVHRDLAARNCMIDAQNVLKVADFGLSESVYTRDYIREQKTSGPGIKLPIKWMALESITDGIFSEKSDVWSFGVTCWEVYNAGKTPYPGTHPAYMIEMLERGERLHKPNNAACCQSVYSLMLSCWQALPEDRPSFSGLVENLTSILMPLADYLSVGTFGASTLADLTECVEGEVYRNAEARHL